jgi:hypothetical protein
MAMTLNPTQHLDGANGAARQGDVLIWPVPTEYTVSRQEKLPVKDGRIILLEGEATGHHHSIGVRLPMPTMFRDDAMAYSYVGPDVQTSIDGDASLYRDTELAQRLVRDGILMTAQLCVGFLEVTDAPISVTHQEHGAISVPPGLYYVGRQQEFSLGEMRNVQD